ncbi:DUF4868 domain-containing protein [Aeromonas veronii]|uniref:DUF4868 domain-containing protein n=1 Tax=Aeromonas veronii TaxID=654 RepID=A0A3A9IPB2_AERVE|nr:Kiwa anti-phage protein KwaB-like domain-containing protein [Aeromonas veronii]RKJ90091.1 DUF4868 domain-containing protein [Aeromonas veronii]
MELFAITDSSVAVNIVKISIDRDTQKAISELFLEQHRYFESKHTDEVEFCGGYITSENEFFSISDFDDVLGVVDAINTPDAVPTWDPEVISVYNISALFVGTPGIGGAATTVLLQSFDKRQIIDNARTIFQQITLDKKTFTLAKSEGLSLDAKLTAILVGDKLIFKNFNNLRRIFDVDGYFKEATKEELISFSQHSHFKLSDGFELDVIADTVIRKKVTLINKSRILEEKSVQELLDAAGQLGVHIDVDITNLAAPKMIMPVLRKDVKRLLAFLDEDYFISQITQTKFRANSKVPAK